MTLEDTVDCATKLIRVAAMNRGLAGEQVEAGHVVGLFTELLLDHGLIADVMYEAEWLAMAAYGHRIWDVNYVLTESAALGIGLVAGTGEGEYDGDSSINDAWILMCCTGALKSLVRENDDGSYVMQGILERHSLEVQDDIHVKLPEAMTIISAQAKKLCIQNAPSWSYLDPELALAGTKRPSGPPAAR